MLFFLLIPIGQGKVRDYIFLEGGSRCKFWRNSSVYYRPSSPSLVHVTMDKSVVERPTIIGSHSPYTVHRFGTIGSSKLTHLVSHSPNWNDGTRQRVNAAQLVQAAETVSSPEHHPVSSHNHMRPKCREYFPSSARAQMTHLELRKSREHGILAKVGVCWRKPQRGKKWAEQGFRGRATGKPNQPSKLAVTFSSARSSRVAELGTSLDVEINFC